VISSNGFASSRTDLLLLGGDPLVDIRNTRNLRGVVTAGRYLDSAALDRLLAAAAPAAAR
jgi:hypothetical protein